MKCPYARICPKYPACPKTITDCREFRKFAEKEALKHIKPVRWKPEKRK